MRNPKRIKLILEKIEQIWTKNPDLRLIQLLSNVLYNANKIEKGNYKLEETLMKCGYNESNPPDVKSLQFLDKMIADANKGVSEDYFYIEDDILLEQLEKWGK